MRESDENHLLPDMSESPEQQMPHDSTKLKTMPLYRDVDRIYKELRAANLDDVEKLAVADLAPFDQYHYHGTDAVDEAIEILEINETSRVLEIGSGIGGPARHIAATTGAHVTALELQADLNETATALTKRCGVEDKVEQVCGDALTYEAGERQFDMVVSWLAFFHIPDRTGLLANCYHWLQDGGKMLVEDLCALGNPTPDEQHDLEVLLYSQYLPDRRNYEADYLNAGFLIEQSIDMSAGWRDFTNERYRHFSNARERHLEVHGKKVFSGLDLFYGTVARLFAAGNLGGLRIIGHKPGDQK